MKNLRKSEPLLKIKKNDTEQEQQFNITRNYWSKQGKEFTEIATNTYKYLLKIDQVIVNENTDEEYVADNLDFEFEKIKKEKQEEIQKEFAEIQISANDAINRLAGVIMPLIGYTVKDDGLIVFNTGIERTAIQAMCEEFVNMFQENKQTAMQILTIFRQTIENGKKDIRSINAYINMQILRQKKKQELLDLLEKTTTIEEVQAIDIDKAKQEVQIELDSLLGIKELEGLEGL